jgi:nitrogen fixation NifU-like protein
MPNEKFDEFVDNLQKEIIEKEIQDHNERIVELFHDPPNWGKPPDDEITASKSYKNARNETMEFFLKINDNDIIERASFSTDGCGCMVATGSQTTLLITGQSIKYVEKLKPEEVDEALNGLPADEKHCAEFAISILRRLVEDYLIAKEMIEEDVDIPVEHGKINLKGTIYYSRNTLPKAPFIINMAGFGDHRESYFVKLFSKKFANEGFYVLSYDYRAHGETAKQTRRNISKVMQQIFTDIEVVITWVLEKQKERLLEDNIVLFGRSLGGAIILTQGYVDKRVKLLIAMCTRFDYHTVPTVRFSEEDIEFISPKYYLKKDPTNDDRILIGHCQDDDIIPFKNLFQIKEQLGLNEENVITYEGGKHAFSGYRHDLFFRSIEFINKKLNIKM